MGGEAEAQAWTGLDGLDVGGDDNAPIPCYRWLAVCLPAAPHAPDIGWHLVQLISSRPR